MSKRPHALLLASGGLDSTTLAYWLINKGIEFIPLFLDYGQHCVETERNTLLSVLPKELADGLISLNISEVYRGTSSRLISEADLWVDSVSADDLYLPYRNLMTLSVAAAFAQSHGIRVVYSAFINSNHAKEIDCSSEFFNKLGALLEGYGSVKIEMPFRELSKYEVAKIGINLGAPIGETFSCQAASLVPCGACPNCVDRLDALKQLEESLSNK